MQLYALDDKHQLVAAAHAVRQRDYLCLECQKVVRRRSGVHRQPHFYHLASTHFCRQNAKSMEHLQTQLFLLKQLPQGESMLEYRFPEINRIADLVWIPQKLVFEVQCSAITANEVRQRNLDYASLGYRVVWILHDQRYNQDVLSAAEQFLSHSTAYFTNMDREGCGIIYDQLEIRNGGVRETLLSSIAVDLAKPLFHTDLKEACTHELPNLMKARLEHWQLGFEGDLIDLALLKKDQKILEKILKAIEADKKLLGLPTTWIQKAKWLWNCVIVKPYHLIFQSFLEKSCK